MSIITRNWFLVIYNGRLWNLLAERYTRFPVVLHKVLG